MAIYIVDGYDTIPANFVKIVFPQLYVANFIIVSNLTMKSCLMIRCRQEPFYVCQMVLVLFIRKIYLMFKVKLYLSRIHIDNIIILNKLCKNERILAKSWCICWSENLRTNLYSSKLIDLRSNHNYLIRTSSISLN